MNMKFLPLGIQTFEKLIKGNYLYVDKTKDIYHLLKDGGTYYFLSRPRRFGKSLLISTLKALFSGQQELFKDLWIYDQIQWKSYPIIHIDFTDIVYSEGTLFFKETIVKSLKENALKYHVKITEKNYKLAFKQLITQLAKHEKVVILIDEYDKPIIDFIGNPIALENRDILKNFYETMKSCDPYIHFVFLTGVSKFSKVSVFSGLNNLTDLTLHKQFASMTGYTQDELSHYFQPYLEAMVQELNTDTTTLITKIKEWYNGYSWDGKTFLYNPYSILSLFSQKQFNNYWFATGTPTFLIKLIQEHDFNIQQFEHCEAKAKIFESYDVDHMNLIALFFQTGYLTIKHIEEIDFTERDYILSYPNLEVKESLLNHILSDFSQIQQDTGMIISKLGRSLVKNDLDGFFQLMTGLFAGIPSDIFIKDKEAYYHTIIYLILTLMGVRVSAEVHTNKGRIDAVIQTLNHIYIFEFKLGTAEKALEQIEDKKYYEKYQPLAKDITLIGVGFSIEEKNIHNYLVKRVK